MNSFRPRVLLPAALIVAALSHSPRALAQASPGTLQTEQAVHATTLPNGIEVTAHGTILQVTALRDDVLRVRAAHNGHLPEDASWAVLSTARSASIQTVPETSGGSMGFHTAALRVRL